MKPGSVTLWDPDLDVGIWIIVGTRTLTFEYYPDHCWDPDPYHCLDPDPDHYLDPDPDLCWDLDQDLDPLLVLIMGWE